MINQAMDEAAEAAEKDFHDRMEPEDIPAFVKWYKDHYLKAGYKRLGKMLVRLAKAQE